MTDKRLIAALDFHTMEEVQTLVNKLGDSVSYYKVGMELFYSVGGEVVTWLRAQGKDVFLDLKLHDIPNTVASGLCSLMELEPTMLNVHASGGYTMMKTAADRLHEEAERRGISCPKLIAVTVLTSIDKDDWNHMGQSLPIKSTVVRWAMLARKAGLDGVVASPQVHDARQPADRRFPTSRPLLDPKVDFAVPPDFAPPVAATARSPYRDPSNP